jgi:hypothetical protein
MDLFSDIHYNIANNKRNLALMLLNLFPNLLLSRIASSVQNSFSSFSVTISPSISSSECVIVAIRGDYSGGGEATVGVVYYVLNEEDCVYHNYYSVVCKRMTISVAVINSTI